MIDVLMAKFTRNEAQNECFHRMCQLLEDDCRVLLSVYDNTQNVGIAIHNTSLPFVCLMDFNFDVESFNVDWTTMVKALRDDTTGMIFPYCEGVAERGVGEFTEVEEVSCDCILMRRDVLEEMGALDESPFTTYADWNIAGRLKDNGYRLMQHNLSCVKHVSQPQLPHAKTNLVIASWGGKRRSDKHSDLTPCGCGNYIEKQVASLTKYRHNLARITIVDADCGKPYPALDAVPSSIRETPVEVVRVPNGRHMSVSAWSHIILTEKDSFDYYVLIEDDYVFVCDDFDELLISMHQMRGTQHLMLAYYEAICRYKIDKGGFVMNGIVDSGALAKRDFSYTDVSLAAFLDHFRVTSFDARYRAPYFCSHGIVYFGQGDDVIVPTQMVDENANVVIPQNWVSYDEIPFKEKTEWLNGLHQ